jgi:hypothetical protein
VIVMGKGKAGGSGLVKVGTHLAAPGAKTVMNGKKSSAGGKSAPQVRVGTHLAPRKGGSRGR